MRRLFLVILLLSMPLSLLAKQWPSNALTQLKQNQGIQVDCNFVSAMLGRDMSNEYPQKLLQAYKNAYPDYADFEKYTIQYRYSIDPIRVSILKSLVRNCSFSAVWVIMESNSPVVQRMRNSDPSKYSRLKSLTISNLQSSFGSVEKFAEEMAVSPTSASSKMNSIVEQAARQLESGSMSSYSGSRSISVPSNRIDTEEHTWRVISVELADGKTILYKQVTPKLVQTWIGSNTSEFIEDAETGRKYYISSSSIGINTQRILSNSNPYSFTEVYPQLPSTVRYINISSGSQYYVRNLRIR